MPDRSTEREAASRRADGEHAHAAGQRWRHWGLMALCCLPMIAIMVVVLLGALGLR